MFKFKISRIYEIRNINGHKTLKVVCGCSTTKIVILKINNFKQLESRNINNVLYRSQ